jgi:RNA polymerase sigma factor (sigma-70 family)
MKHRADPFRRLYDANHERVRHVLARVVGSQEADDLTQTVFAKAAKGLPTFRGDAETSTWLYRIAVNVASDWLRSRSTQEAKLTVPLANASDDDMRAATIGSADVDGLPSPEQQLSHKDMRDCIRREIGKLPDAHRDVLGTLGRLHARTPGAGPNSFAAVGRNTCPCHAHSRVVCQFAGRSDRGN